MTLPAQCTGETPCPYKKRLDAGTEGQPDTCPDCGESSKTEPSPSPEPSGSRRRGSWRA